MKAEEVPGLHNPQGPDDPIIKRLRKVVKENPDLADVVRVYEAVLTVLRGADITVLPVLMTTEEARAKLEKGVPLLHDLPFELDDREVLRLLLRLAAAVEKSAGQNMVCAEAACRIRLALEEGRLNVTRLLQDIGSGASEGAFPAAEGLGLDPGMLRTLLFEAVRPFLRSWCLQLAPLADGVAWDRGLCPVCGAAAAMAELQGNNQAKHLRCGACGADWTFRRLQCLYCGNEDHKSLGLLYSDDDRDRVRVEVCDRCHGYLKVITAYEPSSAWMLKAEDLATLHMDYIARARGYSRVEFLYPSRDVQPA